MDLAGDAFAFGGRRLLPGRLPPGPLRDERAHLPQQHRADDEADLQQHGVDPEADDAGSESDGTEDSVRDGGDGGPLPQPVARSGLGGDEREQPGCRVDRREQVIVGHHGQEPAGGDDRGESVEPPRHPDPEAELGHGSDEHQRQREEERIQRPQGVALAEREQDAEHLAAHGHDRDPPGVEDAAGEAVVLDPVAHSAQQTPLHDCQRRHRCGPRHQTTDPHLPPTRVAGGPPSIACRRPMSG